MHLLQLDDSTISVLALLIGMIGGYQVTAWHAQLKAKRVRITRRPSDLTRRAD